MEEEDDDVEYDAMPIGYREVDHGSMNNDPILTYEPSKTMNRFSLRNARKRSLINTNKK